MEFIIGNSSTTIGLKFRIPLLVHSGHCFLYSHSLTDRNLPFSFLQTSMPLLPPLPASPSLPSDHISSPFPQPGLLTNFCLTSTSVTRLSCPPIKPPSPLPSGDPIRLPSEAVSPRLCRLAPYELVASVLTWALNLAVQPFRGLGQLPLSFCSTAPGIFHHFSPAFYQIPTLLT